MKGSGTGESPINNFPIISCFLCLQVLLLVIKGIVGNYDGFHIFRSFFPSKTSFAFQIKARNLAKSTHQGGIMIRESQAPDSNHISIFMRGDGALVQATRSENGGNTTLYAHESVLTGEENIHLGLIQTRKQKCSFTSFQRKCHTDHFIIRTYYKTDDNIGWIQFGPVRRHTMNGNDGFFGIAVTSNNNNELAEFQVKESHLTIGHRLKEISFSTLEGESCSPSARKVRLHLSSPVDDIEAFEFQITFSNYLNLNTTLMVPMPLSVK